MSETDAFGSGLEIGWGDRDVGGYLTLFCDWARGHVRWEGGLIVGENFVVVSPDQRELFDHHVDNERNPYFIPSINKGGTKSNLAHDATCEGVVIVLWKVSGHRVEQVAAAVNCVDGLQSNDRVREKTKSVFFEEGGAFDIFGVRAVAQGIDYWEECFELFAHLGWGVGCVGHGVSVGGSGGPDRGALSGFGWRDKRCVVYERSGDAWSGLDRKMERSMERWDVYAS